MSKHKDFGMAVLEGIETVFAQPNGLGVFIYDDVAKIYIFRFTGRPQQQSDAVSDLAEKAIREVEFWIQDQIKAGGGVFFVHQFRNVLPERYAACFPILDRPQRIEFYADTFRKGIAKLRQSYGV